jgi:glycosyltransferase involved in cell wall biosynthesis
MIYLACFIFGFALIRLIVATVNLIFDPRLKRSYLKEKPFLSVLIPARNEALNISNILNDLTEQDYTNLEIIVFNDNSADNTREIVKQSSAQNSIIKLINSEKLPEEWLGKNYGCHTLSRHAKGDYFLFLDADVRVHNTLIASAIAHLQRNGLGLLSIFPTQQMNSTGEKIIVPVMNMILLSLLPLVLVRISKKPSLSAANGQFMLFDAPVYKKLKPHETTRGNKVEDIAIARYFKKEGVKIDCLTGNTSIRCRMYTGYLDAVNGFSKNLVAFFGNSYLLAILYWLITTFGVFIILFTLPVSYLISYIIITILCRIFISIISHQSIIDNLVYAFLQQLSIGHINCKTLTNHFFKPYKWKGREIN